MKRTIPIVMFTVLNISLAMIGCKSNVANNDSIGVATVDNNTTATTLSEDACQCGGDDGFVTFNDDVLVAEFNNIHVLDYHSTWSDEENCFTDCEGVIAVDTCVPKVGQILVFESCDVWYDGDSLRIESITEQDDGTYRVTGQHVDGKDLFEKQEPELVDSFEKDLDDNIDTLGDAPEEMRIDIDPVRIIETDDVTVDIVAVGTQKVDYNSSSSSADYILDPAIELSVSNKRNNRVFAVGSISGFYFDSKQVADKYAANDSDWQLDGNRYEAFGYVEAGSHKNVTSTITLDQFDESVVLAELPKEMIGSIWVVDPAVNDTEYSSDLKPLAKCDLDILINDDDVAIEHSLAPLTAND